MAHSILKNRVTDNLFCSHWIVATRNHLDLHNAYRYLYKSIISPISRLLVNINLCIACLPLHTIRTLPFCLPGVRPVDFYHQQWLDDVQHLVRARHKLQYSLARVPDATRLAWNYGILVMLGINQKNSCGTQCECKRDNKEAM